MTAAKDILAQLEGAIARDPGHTAFDDGKRRISYETFGRQIDEVARALSVSGVKPAHRVGVEIGGFYAHWVACFAVMRLGAVAAALSGDRVEKSRQAGLDLAISNVRNSSLDESDLKIIPLTDRYLRQVKGAEHVALPPIDEAARNSGRIFFSSGTTGVPKGILFRMAALTGMSYANMEGLDRKTVRLSGTGMDRPQAGTMAVLLCGGTNLLPEEGLEDRPKLAKTVARANVIATSTASLTGILKSSEGAFPGREERSVRVGGAPLPRPVRDEALERLCREVIVSYGTTETGPIARGDAMLLDRHPGAVGTLMPGVELRVVDDGGRDVGDGQGGEFRIRTPYMVDKYLGDEATNGQFFRDGWFCPGDIGIKQSDGMVVILGRKQDVLNLGGAKFSANVIEDIVRRQASVTDVCAVAVPESSGVETCLILIVGPGSESEDEIAAALAPHFAKIGLRRFVLRRTGEIPRNARGKVSRDKIRDVVLRTRPQA